MTPTAHTLASKPLIGVALCVAICSAVACAPTAPGDDDDDDDSTPTPDDDVPDPLFEPFRVAVEKEMEALGAPGVAVGIWRDGEIVFEEGFGSKGPNQNDPVLGSTLFRIGSVTKMMTAAAVMQQVDNGEFGLDSTLQSVWPEFDLATRPGWSAEATVEHTLNHTHALYDYLEIDSTTDDDALAEWVFEDAAESLPVWAPPGRFWNYSNPGYYLAGLLAETGSGRTYRETLADGVLLPLGMTRSFFLADEVLNDGDFATGDAADWEGGTDRREAGPDSYDNAWGRPAGYLWSSVGDLLRFSEFVLDGDDGVLSPESRMALVEPKVSMVSVGDHEMYGLGWMVTDGFATRRGWYDEPLWTHGGAIHGFAAELFVLPEQRLAFAFLANTDGAYFRDAIEALLPLVTDVGAPGPVPSLPPRADFTDLAGAWDDTYNIGATTITWDGERLLFDVPLLDEYDIPYSDELTPYQEDSFLWEVQGAPQVMTVIRDAEGAPEYLRFRFSVSHRPEGEARGEPTRLDAGALRALLNRPSWP